MKLCMGGDHGANLPGFCEGGDEHPLTPHRTSIAHAAPPLLGGRSLQDRPPVDAACGDEPALDAPEHSNWVLCAFCGSDQTAPSWAPCFFDFFSGNGYSKQHCETVLPISCCADPGCGGEPHFKTWADYWYDYHGECDLNFVHAPSFAEHLGLDIHIRTKIRDNYSFIESAAIKIGSDVVEISSFGSYLVNGVEGAYVEEEQAQLGAFKLNHEQESKKIHHYSVDVGDHKIRVKTVKDFVSVTLDHANIADYFDSVGMLGRFGTGTLLGRDGKTHFTLDNINEFGQEWQVLPDDPKLFENSERAPQHPATCRLPHPSASVNRRLADGAVSEEEAEEACEGWKPGYKDKCVYDVLATNDLDLAEGGAY